MYMKNAERDIKLSYIYSYSINLQNYFAIDSYVCG